MPQYPLPPWPEDNIVAFRTKAIGPDNPRFTHVPLVRADGHGDIEVVRGDEDRVRELFYGAPRGEQDVVFNEPGAPLFFVATNRLGTTRVIWAEQTVTVGRLEAALYTDNYLVSPLIEAATSLDELIAALEDEVASVRALAADGWTLAKHDSGRQVLVDERRPDEQLSRRPPPRPAPLGRPVPRLPVVDQQRLPPQREALSTFSGACDPCPRTAPIRDPVTVQPVNGDRPGDRRPQPLTDIEVDVLAFAKLSWRFVGAQESAIRERFGWSPTRYFQVLNVLIDRPEALAHDPLLVNRLRRLRAERARQRTARRARDEQAD